jgi:hypothetical protein
MPILSKGTTFTSNQQVTAALLNSLVDSATFVTGAGGAVDGVTMDISGGQLIVKNGGITPTKLSEGHPSWDTSNNLTVSGTLTTGGTISTSNNLAVNGTSALTGDITCSGKIIRSGTSSNRTVQLQTASDPLTANTISFGYDEGNLLVTVGTNEFTIALTPA